jgi:hypothetical protein
VVVAKPKPPAVPIPPRRSPVRSHQPAPRARP